MPELGAIRSSHTLDPEPSVAQLTPPPLLVNAEQASPQAALDAVITTANEKNTLNNIMAGGGSRRRLRRRTCTCRRKKCTCMSHSRSRSSRITRSSRSSRSKSKKYKGKRFTASQRQIVNRRVELNLLHRKIRKNKNAQNQNRSQTQRQAQYGGNANELPIAMAPQHGASCGPDQHNCPGNTSKMLLEASRQSTVNAQGDNPVLN